MSTSHRSNLIGLLQNEIQERLESVSTDYQAFVRIAAEWLGYTELDEERNFVDRGGDRGIDFWHASDSDFNIFQVKSHKLDSTRKISTGLFDSEGVSDLQRAVTFLTNEAEKSSRYRRMNELRKHWESIIATQLMADDRDTPFQVSLGLILFGDGLTSQARDEFDSLAESLKNPLTYKGVPLEFRAQLYTIDDIILYRWREDNREWRDRHGRRRNSIKLTPKDQGNTPQWISGQHDAVFYCKAHDLIQAFDNFGYQLFEPNVRAHIRKSKVNAAIKQSLKHMASRREFQFLNNGLTVTCNNYRKPNKNRSHFEVIKPGIVNGLQTVIALHEAYYELDQKHRAHLEGNCWVLVRLLREKAVRDVNKVVLASNTQNQMQPRNLRSNTSEQIFYERLFAKLGWFYERKQGAWDAFSSDPSRWRTLPNYRKIHFQVQPRTSGRPKHRVVDNELLAQTWLSFIGFSNDAVHKKRLLFDEDDWYNLIFLHRTSQHAARANFSLSVVQENWTDEAPSHALMLISYLARDFAKQVSLSTRKNRELACKRLNLDPESLSKEELDSELANDDDYLLEQVISAMSYLFVEFFGYILYEALGSDLHDAGNFLLENGSLRDLTVNLDFDLVTRRVREEEIEKDDFLLTAWFAFRHTIHQLMAGPWKQRYQTARNRSRFTHSTDTRSHIYKQVNDLDKFMRKSQLTQVWAADIPSKTGLFQYFSDTINRQGKPIAA